MRKRIGLIGLATVVALTAAGCASNQNLKEGEGLFGGGYQVTPVSNAIFYIYARTNAAMLAQYETARKMFMERASEACASKDVATLRTRMHLNDSNFTPLIVTEAYGYAVCLNAGLSQDAIDAAIAKYEKGGVK